MRSRQPEPHTLAGAYVMDALDGRSCARFERHLARCPECAREVSGLRETTARLAAAAAAPPPAALRARLLAQTARTRQLPPVTRADPAAPARRRDWAGSAGSRRRRAPRRTLAPWPALVLAGIAVLGAAAVWLTGQASRPAATAQAQRGEEIAAVLTAPDATMISAQVRTGGTATVVMSHRERILVFAAAGLRRLPASRCYQLWLLEPGRDRPAGVLPMASHGMTGPVLESGLRSGDRLGLSVEPTSGSRRPTSAMLLVLAL